MNSQKSGFASNLKELQTVAKERHVVFVQDLKKVREDVTFKLQELCEDMEKALNKKP